MSVGRLSQPRMIPTPMLSTRALTLWSKRGNGCTRRSDGNAKYGEFMKLTQIVWVLMLALGTMLSSSAAAEIKIGAAEALTGNASQYGAPIRKGLELALREINSSGGINGQNLALTSKMNKVKRKRRSTFSKN